MENTVLPWNLSRNHVSLDILYWIEMDEARNASLIYSLQYIPPVWKLHIFREWCWIFERGASLNVPGCEFIKKGVAPILKAFQTILAVFNNFCWKEIQNHNKPTHASTQRPAPPSPQNRNVLVPTFSMYSPKARRHFSEKMTNRQKCANLKESA